MTLSSRRSAAMCARLAPKAPRTASSCRRPSTRARSKLATLARAISRTKPIEPIKSPRRLATPPPTRRIILLGKAAAQQGRHAEEWKSAIRNAQGTNLFWLGHAGHAHGVARVKTEVLEGAILVAEDEVVGGGQLEFF